MKKPFPLGLILCAGLLPHTGSAAWQTAHTLASPDGALGIELFTDDPTIETVTRVAIHESVVDRNSTITRQVGVRNGLAAILIPTDGVVTR